MKILPPSSSVVSQTSFEANSVQLRERMPCLPNNSSATLEFTQCEEDSVTQQLSAMTSFLDQASSYIKANDWSATKPRQWPSQLVDVLVEGLEKHVVGKKDWWKTAVMQKEVSGKTPKLEALLGYIARIPEMPTGVKNGSSSTRAYKADDRQLAAIQIGRAMTRHVSDENEINTLIGALADLIAPEGKESRLSDVPHRNKSLVKSFLKPAAAMDRALKWGDESFAKQVATLVATIPVVSIMVASAPVAGTVSVARDLSRQIKNVNKAINWMSELLSKIEKSETNGTQKMTLTDETLKACALIYKNNKESRHLNELDWQIGRIMQDAPKERTWEHYKREARIAAVNLRVDEYGNAI